ncbi:unnamed protein product [Caenorhabditis sp. 36 PRJEB53466]|nr:unnamed protein product [Caenorhabditis sp. 36 PRJEB53466]
MNEMLHKVDLQRMKEEQMLMNEVNLNSTHPILKTGATFETASDGCLFDRVYTNLCVDVSPTTLAPSTEVPHEFNPRKYSKAVSNFHFIMPIVSLILAFTIRLEIMSTKPKNKPTGRRKNKPSAAGPGDRSGNSMRKPSALGASGNSMRKPSKDKNPELSSNSSRSQNKKQDSPSLFGRSLMKKMSQEPSGNSKNTARSLQKAPKKETPENSTRKKKEEQEQKHVFAVGDSIDGINVYKVVSALHRSPKPSEVDVYAVKDENGEEVRMKVSNLAAFQLKKEAVILQKLLRHSSGDGERSFVTMLEYGTTPKCEFLICTPFGTTLQEVMKNTMNGASFSLDCAIAVGLQMLKGIKDLHAIGWLHRNIRPAAFHVGLGAEETSIFLQDFRNVRKYEEAKKVIPAETTVRIDATARYGPRCVLSQKDLGRKDDLESWLYSLYYMIDAATIDWKRDTSIQWLSIAKEAFMKNEGPHQYTKVPRALAAAVTLIAGYDFAAEPDYDRIRKILTDVQTELKLNASACDWKGKPNLQEITGDTQRSFDNVLTGGPENKEQSKRDENKTRDLRKKLMPGDVIQSQADSKTAWRVVNLLGSGGFGDVYKVHRNEGSSSKCYALKTEREGDKRFMRLKIEVAVMMKTAEKKKQGLFENFVEFVDRGKCEELKCKYVVMGLVGRSLYDVRNKYMIALSPSTCFNIAIQTVASVRDLHSIGYLHRDIKPGNFAVGLGEHESTIFMLDFGIAKLYLDANGNHKVRRRKVNFIGTFQFASRACMEMQEQGRKDDLETWLYMVYELFREAANKINESYGLPWRLREEPDEILEAKKNFFHMSFDRAPRVPKHLRRMGPLVSYIDGLAHEQTPDYQYIEKFLKKTASDFNVKLDKKMDWVGRLGKPPPPGIL